MLQGVMGIEKSKKESTVSFFRKISSLPTGGPSPYFVYSDGSGGGATRKNKILPGLPEARSVGLPSACPSFSGCVQAGGPLALVTAGLGKTQILGTK